MLKQNECSVFEECMSKKNSKVEKILEATIELVARSGLQHTPMSKVSKESGVSVGGIYHHFTTKEEIFLNAYIEIRREIATILFKNCSEENNFKEKFFISWRNFFDYLYKNPQKLSFLEQCSNNPELMKLAQTKINSSIAAYIGFIEEGIATGQIENMKISLLFALINGSVLQTVSLKIKDSSITEDDITKALEYCWKGLQPEGKV
jgi:AcrR family transcriptional regulator